MTPKELNILRHSLGFDDAGNPRFKGPGSYRNKFVSGPDGDDFKSCCDLVASGHMRDHGPQSMMSGMHYFTVTQLGEAAVDDARPSPKKLTRSQKRYRDYREVADCFDSFRDYLAHIQQKAREERMGGPLTQAEKDAAEAELYKR